jgi:hypothetical protein
VRRCHPDRWSLLRSLRSRRAAASPRVSDRVAVERGVVGIVSRDTIDGGVGDGSTDSRDAIGSRTVRSRTAYARTVYSRTVYSRTVYSRTIYSRTVYSRTVR